MEKIVEINNLTKIYDNKKVAVDHISFDVYKGEILGFVGPNGSGKTTTLKLMLGLLKPTEGTIYIDGYDVHKQFEKALINVGNMLETPAHYEYLSGYDNLLLSMRMYKGVIKADVDRAVHFVGLSDHIHDKVRKYSFGMKQRLGIARAILHSPKLLILDEPMNGLDPDGMKELRGMLTEIAKVNNTAVIVSSHILSEISHISDRIVFIKNGHIVSIMDNIGVTDSLEDKYFELMGNDNGTNS